MAHYGSHPGLCTSHLTHSHLAPCSLHLAPCACTCAWACAPRIPSPSQPRSIPCISNPATVPYRTCTTTTTVSTLPILNLVVFPSTVVDPPSLDGPLSNIRGPSPVACCSLRFLPFLFSLYPLPASSALRAPSPSSPSTTDSPALAPLSSPACGLVTLDDVNQEKRRGIALTLFVSTLRPIQRQSAHGLELDLATSDPSRPLCMCLCLCFCSTAAEH